MATPQTFEVCLSALSNSRFRSRLSPERAVASGARTPQVTRSDGPSPLTSLFPDDDRPRRGYDGEVLYFPTILAQFPLDALCRAHADLEKFRDLVARRIESWEEDPWRTAY